MTNKKTLNNEEIKNVQEMEKNGACVTGGPEEGPETGLPGSEESSDGGERTHVGPEEGPETGVPGPEESSDGGERTHVGPEEGPETGVPGPEESPDGQERVPDLSVNQTEKDSSSSVPDDPDVLKTAGNEKDIPAKDAGGREISEQGVREAAGSGMSEAAGNTGLTNPGGIGMKDGGEGADGAGKDRSKRTAFWISLLVVLLVVAGVYANGYRYCESHFMPGTRINGIDCSGMTAEEADEQFSKAAESYVLNIRFRGGMTEVLSAQDMGFKYKPDGSVDALLQEQDSLCWMKYFFEDSDYTIVKRGSSDDSLVTKSLQNLPELQKENMQNPMNAYITFQDGNGEEAGRFVIVPDTEGSTIDIVQMEAAVTDAASRFEEVLDLDEKDGVYVVADVTKDDANLISRCNDLNDIVSASITYELPGGETMKINSDVMKNWLVKDNKGRLVKDDEVWGQKIEAFLEDVAYYANTIGTSRKFKSTLRGTITVSGGDYGYMVDQITEKNLLLKDLADGKKDTREPSYHISPYNKETENDGIGTSYIEVDLGAQHIWCYVNGELKMDCDCVSGNASDGHDTPTGVFGIMFMDKDAVLQGAMQSNGKYEYETKVSYWMPFYAECGFHDAWWRTAFGGTIYLKDGSHGCINLPVEGAKELFSWCDVKMPVVVYK